MSAKINASDYSPPNVNYWGDRCCKAEAEVERLTIIIAKISYCDAQTGADAMAMRNIAMDFMRERTLMRANQ